MVSRLYCLMHIFLTKRERLSQGGCKDKYGRWARPRKLAEDNISGVPSGLKGRVHKGDLICKQCFGGQPTTLSNSILTAKIPDYVAGTSTVPDMVQQSPAEKKIKLDISATQFCSVKCLVCKKKTGV